MVKQYYVYILTTFSNRIFYIGVTNNIERRVYEHKNKLVKGFTYKYHVFKLVYYEIFYDPNHMISREKQIKNWHKEWKLNLIRKKNPDLIDLCDSEGNIVNTLMLDAETSSA